MNNGKVKEAILERTIFKAISYKDKAVISGPKEGNDAAVLSNNEEVTVISTNPVTYNFKGMEELAIASAVNNVIAKGGVAKAVELTILMPERYKETALKKVMQKINAVCREYNVTISGGHTEVTPAVNSVVLSVTAIGACNYNEVISNENIKTDMDIVMSKYIALPGTLMIYDKKKYELGKRFSSNFIESVTDYAKYYNIYEEAQIAKSQGVFGMHDVSRGGIMNALWEMAENGNVGIEIDVDKILVKQETIEFCELFNLNPYEMMSTGVLLMVTNDGDKLASELRKEEIPASVIGRTTNNNDRIIIRNDERGFITPPKGDEIYKIV